jgi:YD repeat-containing protein
VQSAVGSGWFVAQWPQLTQDTSGTTVSAIDGGQSIRTFNFNGSSYVAQGFVLDQLTNSGTDLQLTDTKGNVTLYYGFDSSIAKELRGKVKQYTDAGGNKTVFTYDATSHLLTKLQRKLGNSSTVLEELDYTYGTGSHTALVTDVTMQRADASNVLGVVRSVHYDYQDFGNLNLLQLATIENPDNSAVSYDAYRYDAKGRLTHVLEGESVMRAAAELGKTPAQISDPSTVTNAQLEPYADLIFVYDESNRLGVQTIKGKGSYTYVYETPSTNANDFNSWKTKTIEYLPDDTPGSLNDNDFNVVYSNYAGEVLASVFVARQNDADPNDDPAWITAYQYDSSGRLLLTSHPSAAVQGETLSTVDAAAASNPNLVSAILSSSSGLVDVNSYANGYLQYTALRHGVGGTDNKIEAFTYGQARGPVGRLVTNDVLYRDESNAHPITTTYAYTLSGNLVTQRTTTLPSVDSTQNGGGSAQEVETFDTFGRRLTLVDGDSATHTWTYVDSTGAIKSAAVSGTGLPSGGLVTAYESDRLGRTTKITEPKTTSVTMIAYTDLAQYSEIRTTPPAVSSPGISPPIQVVRSDHSTATVDVLSLSRSGGNVLSLARSVYADPNRIPASATPDTGLLYVVERYNSTDSLTYSAASGIGGSGSKYRTEYSYDIRGRQTRVAAGRDLYTGSISATNPTITTTTYDALNRPTEVWMGTDDTTLGNMTKVMAYEYDGGALAVGDGNLTKITKPTDGTSTDDRLTLNFYDWRDRLVAIKSGSQGSEAGDVNRPLTYTKYDNLNRPVIQYVFDGDGITPSVSGGLVSMPSDSAMRAATLTQYDDRGRVYRATTFNVLQGIDGGASGPSSAAVSTSTAAQLADASDTTLAGMQSLRTDTWFDNRNNVIKTRQPGGLVNKNVYDAASRLITTYTTDGHNDSSYADAASVSDDAVLEEVDTQYDDNGNAILVTTKQRWHDATGAGPLVAGNEFDTSLANARVSFVANWFDEADRLIHTVDYGNNGNNLISNSDSTMGSVIDPTQAPQNRSATDGWDLLLRIDYAYNDQGYVQDVTDPRNIKTRTQYDALGRRNVLFEAYQDGVVGNSATHDDDRKTTWQYNGYDQVTDQFNTTYSNSIRTLDTVYTYGVAKDSKNFINNSGLLKSITYGAVTGVPTDPNFTDKETSSGYNAQGELTEKTQRDGSIHHYTLNVLGQMTADTWTNTSIHSNLMSTWATELDYTYDAIGRGLLYTTKNGTTPLNQIRRDYDGLGNMIAEWQDHAGTVTSSSPVVQYVFDTNYTSNYSRQQQLVYPNGRVVSDVYGHPNNSFTAALNNAISRVGYTADGGTPSNSDILERDDYLGLNQVVIRDYPNSSSGVGLSYWTDLLDSDEQWFLQPDRVDGGTSDPYRGLDRFGRVIEQNWNGPENRNYAYDADSNVLYERVRLTSNQESWKSSLYHAPGATAATAYDNLNRMTAFYRGNLTVGGSGTYNGVDQTDTSIPTEYLSETYGATSNTNFNYARTDANADPGGQVFQKQVPLTPFTPNPTPSGPRRDVFVEFDAWGRLQVQADSTLSTQGQASGQWAYQAAYTKNYTYDALGRRISENDNTDNQTTDFYYDADGNVIEDQHRFGTDPPTTQNQYVFSAADPSMMTVRDRDDDNDASTSAYGKDASGNIVAGSELRVWVLQGPDASVWEVREQNGGSLGFEQYLYTPEGKVSIVRRNSNASGDYDVNLPNSTYSWQYLWRMGRASIDHAPSDPNDVTSPPIEVFDGLTHFAGGLEQDTLTGNPVAEDVYAYDVADNTYDPASTVNINLPGNGTTDTFIHPVGNGGYDTMLDAFLHPSHYGKLGQVTTPTKFRVAQVIGVVGLSAITGGYAAVGLGALGASGLTVAVGSGFAGGFVGGFAGSASSQLEFVGGEGFSFKQAALSGVKGGLVGAATGGLVYGVGQLAKGLISAAENEAVTAFRVEGAGNQRLFIDANGNVQVPEVLTRSGAERNLYLNFGDEARAQEFLQQRLAQFPDDTIKSFQVPQSFVDELRADAVSELERSLYPTRPVIADPTKAANQFGLTEQQIQRLRQSIIQGSGK